MGYVSSREKNRWIDRETWKLKVSERDCQIQKLYERERERERDGESMSYVPWRDKNRWIDRETWKLKVIERD